MTARRVALPIWYVVAIGGLFAAHALVQRDTVLGTALWIGVVTVCASALFALEIAGAKRFSLGEGADAGYLRSQSARVLRGYSLRKRLGYLGQALFCWFLFGIGTVWLADRAGGWLRGASSVLGGASEVVVAWPAAIRVVAAFVLLDAWSYGRHRAEHARNERGLLWRLVHEWHHAPRDLDLWTGMVVHPIEAVFVFAVPCTANAALGLERWELLFLFTLFLVVTMPQHMNSARRMRS